MEREIDLTAQEIEQMIENSYSLGYEIDIQELIEAGFGGWLSEFLLD